MNSRTNVIKQDETRKLDYIDCGKSLKNLYLHLGYIVLLSSIFVKHAPNSHFRCPKNCSIARKKLFCPTLGAAAHTPMHQMNRVNSRSDFLHDGSTINIVVVIIIIIIIIIKRSVLNSRG